MAAEADIRKAIFAFLVLTALLSAVFFNLINLSGGYVLYFNGLMWSPGIAALIVLRFSNSGFQQIGWDWYRTRYQVTSYVLPFLYVFGAYLIIWITGLGEFYDEDFVGSISEKLGLSDLPNVLVIVIYTVFRGVFSLPGYCATALGEEIGWRGFLVPQLAKITGFTGTALISGLIWAVWHFPLFDLTNPGSWVTWYELGCFTAMVVGLSFILAWFRLKTGSVWTSMILHGSHNLFIQQVFEPLTRENELTGYFSDETGVVLALICLLIGLFFWKKRDAIVCNSSESPDS